MSAQKPPRKRLGKGLSAILDTAHSQESKQKTNKVHTHPSVPVRSPVEVPVAAAGPEVATGTAAAPTASATGSDSGASAAGRVREIPVDAIVPGAHQPRTHFNAEALESLAASIRSVGVIQPITVRPAASGGYELIAGERRWRASKIAGLDVIPAIVTDADEQTAAAAALIENLQREDLNPIERADAIRGLIDTFGFSQARVAERVGLDRSSISNLLRLVDLEEPIRDILASGLLGLGHGKALLSMPPGRARVDVAARASREGWSVRRLEEESRRIRAAGSTAPAGESGAGDPPSGDVETRALEKRLGEHLGTKVSLRVERSGKGLVQIRFFDLDHFDDLMSRIGFDLGELD